MGDVERRSSQATSVYRARKRPREGLSSFWLWFTVACCAVGTFVVSWIAWDAILGDRGSRAEGSQSAEAPPQGAGKLVKLCFLSEDGAHLIAEDRTIQADEDPRTLAMRVLEALKRGPSERSLLPALPEKLSFRDVYVDPQGCAIIDLQGGWEHTGVGGVSAEKMAIYAMVNSLVYNIPQIRTVRFVVDGKEVETLMGHLDARIVFRPSAKVMQATNPG